MSSDRQLNLVSYRWRAYIILCAAIIILFFPVATRWKGIFHDDQAMEEFSRYYFVASNLQKGIIPLWDPQTWAGGIPFYARYYANTYYVLLWPFFLLANLANLTQSYWFLIIIPLFLHYLLAAFGMFMFFNKVLKFNNISSSIGALIYTYAPAFAHAYVWQQVVIVQAWLPWLLVICISMLNQPRLWKLLLGGIITAFILTAGAPYLWPLVAIILAGAIIVNVICRYKSKKAVSRIFSSLGIVIIILTIGAGLSSVYLFSFFDGRQHTSEHIKLTVDAALKEDKGSFPPIFLSTLLIPNLFNNITGIDMDTINPTHDVAFWDANLSGGVILTFLVLLGMILGFKSSESDLLSRQRRWYLIIFTFLYIFSILCVLGRHTPFYRYTIGFLPGIGQLPRPVRYRLIQCFATAVLAASGIEYLMNLRLSKATMHLRRWVWIYVLGSFLVVGIVFIYPGGKKTKFFYQWSEQPVSLTGKYFGKNQLVGRYSFDFPTKKIRVMFNGKSSGQIRYGNSDRDFPAGGILVRDYQVSNGGWKEFDVDIPSNKFIWISQKSGNAKIGYKRTSNVLDTFSYDVSKQDKLIHPYANAIWLFQEKTKVVVPLVSRLIRQDRFSMHITFSLLYFAVSCLLIILCVRYLRSHHLSYCLGIIVVFESLIYCLLAFYGNMFNSYEGPNFIPHRTRTTRPLEHQILKRTIDPLAKVAPNTKLRIATDYPFYDNFVRLNDRFALMGYEMHPLEIRFKRAVENTYGFPVGWLYYFNNPQPASVNFLSNFSVGYFMDSNPNAIFSNEVCMSLPGSPDIFVHINSKVLPRAYTINRVKFASEEEQLRQLVSGDLHKAVYINPSFREKLSLSDFYGQKEPFVDFDDLQKINPIRRLDLDNPNRIDVDVDIKQPSMLILTEIWYPGWRAVLDGHPVSLFRINYCQRGVWLNKGIHSIQLIFKPPAWQKGFIISGIFLIATLLLIIFSLSFQIIGGYFENKRI